MKPVHPLNVSFFFGKVETEFEMNTTDGTRNNQALEMDSTERIDLALDDQNEGTDVNIISVA